MPFGRVQQGGWEWGVARPSLEVVEALTQVKVDRMRKEEWQEHIVAEKLGESPIAWCRSAAW